MFLILTMGTDISVRQANAILSTDGWGGVTPNSICDRSAFFVFENGIAKAVCIYKDPSFFYPECLGLGIMAVHENYRGQGLVAPIAQEFFRIACELKKGVRLTEYTTDGEKRAKSVFRRYAEDFHQRTGLEYIEGYEFIHNRKESLRHV